MNTILSILYQRRETKNNEQSDNNSIGTKSAGEMLKLKEREEKKREYRTDYDIIWIGSYQIPEWLFLPFFVCWYCTILLFFYVEKKNEKNARSNHPNFKESTGVLKHFLWVNNLLLFLLFCLQNALLISPDENITCRRFVDEHYSFWLDSDYFLFSLSNWAAM